MSDIPKLIAELDALQAKVREGKEAQHKIPAKQWELSEAIRKETEELKGGKQCH